MKPRNRLEFKLGAVVGRPELRQGVPPRARKGCSQVSFHAEPEKAHRESAPLRRLTRLPAPKLGAVSRFYACNPEAMAAAVLEPAPLVSPAERARRTPWSLTSALRGR